MFNSQNISRFPRISVKSKSKSGAEVASGGKALHGMDDIRFFFLFQLFLAYANPEAPRKVLSSCMGVMGVQSALVQDTVTGSLPGSHKSSSGTCIQLQGLLQH